MLIDDQTLTLYFLPTWLTNACLSHTIKLVRQSPRYINTVAEHYSGSINESAVNSLQSPNVTAMFRDGERIKSLLWMLRVWFDLSCLI